MGSGITTHSIPSGFVTWALRIKLRPLSLSSHFIDCAISPAPYGDLFLSLSPLSEADVGVLIPWGDVFLVTFQSLKSGLE